MPLLMIRNDIAKVAADAMEHDLTVYLVLYDRDSLAVSRKLFVSVEEYIDDHYVQLQ